MVSDQLSSQNNAGSGGMLPDNLLDSIVNLVELSNSELTLSSGGESLPVTGLLLDALLDLIGDRRPDLLAYSQRIGFICSGIADQLKWTRKWTNNLVCAGLLHELGTLTLPSPEDYWNSVGTTEERLAREVSIDFLEATHGDSDLLDILALSHNFRYRTHNDEETPRYVVQAAAALSAVRFFETGRVMPENPRQAPELLASLQSIYNTTEEETQVIDALESWLRSETEINFDPSIFLPSTMSNDPETAEIVRETFQEILDAFRTLQTTFDSYFMLDGTGRFQIWSSKSEKFLGRSVRSMRNTHWSNEIVKYCNEEGFPFSDAQTPLYQTLTTGKPARLHLCMQDLNERLFEVEVNAIPIIGRDQLMQAILEFHKRMKPQADEDSKIVHTAGDVVSLASELLAQFEEDPEQNPLPSVSFEKIDLFEERLRSGVVLEPETEPETEFETETEAPIEQSDSSIFSDDDSEEAVSHDVSEITHSDVLTDPEQTDELTEETPDAIEPEPRPSEETDDLMSRIDDIMSEVTGADEENDDDLAVTDSTIILKSPTTGDSSATFADEEFLSEEPEASHTEPAGQEQLPQVEEFAVGDTPSADETLHVESQPSEPAVSEPTPSENIETTAETELAESADEPQAVEREQPPIEEIEPEPHPEVPLDRPIAEELPVEDQQPADIAPEPAPIEEEYSEPVNMVTESPVEKAATEADSEIAASSPDEPVVEQEPACPTPLVVPELQPDPADFPTDPEEVPESSPEQVPAVAVKEESVVSIRDWEEYVKAVMDDSSSLHDSIGVLLLEIDDLDAVTKEFGQQIVEDLMVEFNRRLSKLCSSHELSCRYGSGQFTVACPGVALKAAYKRGDQLRHQFEKIRFDVMPIKKLTVSVGVTVAEPRDSFDNLMNRVEFALARSRKLGNNCCVALDSDEVRVEKQKERDEEGSRILVNEFVMTAEFEAMIASDMIVYKLGGFLYDLGAKLIKVDRKHVEMRVGARRLLPYWGKNPDSQPVLVDLQLGENWDQKKTSKRAVSNTTLQVRIRPDGWIKDKKVFKARADQVLRALKGYFAAK